MQYNKPPLSISDQAQLLLDRGMQCQTALTRTLYNFLVVIQHMVLHINPSTSWSDRLSELVMPLSEAQHQDMGFPADWQTRKPWVKDTA